jgi:hypothetical protein
MPLLRQRRRPAGLKGSGGQRNTYFACRDRDRFT